MFPVSVSVDEVFFQPSTLVAKSGFGYTGQVVCNCQCDNLVNATTLGLLNGFYFLEAAED